MSYPNSFLVRKSCGFTLIELIVVIMLIAIMAATVLPKFFSSKGFEEHAYRDELITKLRAVQLRAMQQTNGNTCQFIKISASSIGLLATTLNATTCEPSYAGATTTVTIDNNHNISFTISESLPNFSFSSMGRPLGCIATDPCEITLTVVGESSIEIKINTEGYIYVL